MNVFVDTSAFYAVLCSTDSNFSKAVVDWNRLVDDDAVTFFTSNYVIVESSALIRHRLGDAALHSFFDSLVPLTAVLWVDPKVHAAATEAMLLQGIDGPSLVDTSSFAIMRENSISFAFAYDKHFDARGLVLPP